MKNSKLAALVVMIALALFVALPNLAWAEDGAALYKAKCAMCHNADGSGKPAMKAPAVKGADAAKMKATFASSPKHAAVKSLTDVQVKALADYLATLK